LSQRYLGLYIRYLLLEENSGLVDKGFGLALALNIKKCEVVGPSIRVSWDQSEKIKVLTLLYFREILAELLQPLLVLLLLLVAKYDVV